MTRGPSVLRNAFLVLLLSRVVGLSRELLVSTAFGFSKITDAFYQSSFSVVAVQTISNGPFTTAFAARLANAAPADKAAHVRYYMRLSVWIGAFLSLTMLAVAAALRAGDAPLWLSLVMLSPSVFCASITGYVYAVLTAFGRIAVAAFLLFVSNAIFVAAIVAFWFSGAALRSWILPLMFSVAALAGLGWSGRVYSRLLAELDHDHPGPHTPKEIEGLAVTFGLAGLETLMFLVTQTVVLTLASATGPGWASATSVVQRISSSVIGLVISPIASLLMLRVLERPETALRQFLRTILAISLGLAVFGAALALAGRTLLDLAISPQSPKYESALKVTQLLPAFALWLVPLGVTAIVCRVMFGLRLERVYTLATVAAYAVANLARLAVAFAYGLPAVLAAGACIELACSVFLVVFTQGHLRAKRSKDERTPGSGSVHDGIPLGHGQGGV